VFSPPPGTSKRRKVTPAKAFAGPRSECELCVVGDARATCTCVVQDRCAERNDAGHQCMLGAGHSLRHVTAAGKHWK